MSNFTISSKRQKDLIYEPGTKPMSSPCAGDKRHHWLVLDTCSSCGLEKHLNPEHRPINCGGKWETSGECKHCGAERTFRKDTADEAANKTNHRIFPQ